MARYRRRASATAWARDLGISERQLYRLETGETILRAEHLARMARVFGRRVVLEILGI